MEEMKKPSFHTYDTRLERLLKRIKGEVVNVKQTKTNNRARDLSVLTKSNRQQLLDYYRLCVRIGNSTPRVLARLERLTYVFVHFGNKDVATANPQDFEEVADKIMTDPKLSIRTKKERIEQLKMFDKEVG
jgi:hypothetical protein